MVNVSIFPGKYVQGRKALEGLKTHLASFGSKYLAVVNPTIGPQAMERVVDALRRSLNEDELLIVHGGVECCPSEIRRIEGLIRENGCDAVLGVGGGKTLDTAKAAAHYANVPVGVVPTAASSDAPCSALAVIYNEKGQLESRLPLRRNPDLVVMDTEIISRAPARLLAAGMGDALATYVESRRCVLANGQTVAGGTASLTAAHMARLCYETLLADGRKAMRAVQNGVCTQAVENIIEANTLLSGVGFESGGKSAAHAIHDGLTWHPACHCMHGEKVAFGTLCELVLENAPDEELAATLSFLYDVGLPLTLADMGVETVVPAELRAVAEKATAPGSSIFNTNITVNAEVVYDAILMADALGRAYKQTRLLDAGRHPA